MPIVEIDEVHLHRAVADRLGVRLEEPAEGSTSDIYGFDVVLSMPPDNGLDALEVCWRNRVVATAQADSRDGTAPRLQLRARVGALEVPTRFAATVRGVHDADGTIPVGRIVGRREPLRSEGEPRLNPVVLTCLGRTGTTWLTWVLGCHPEITAFEPFSRETRLCAFWLTALQQIGSPQSYLAGFDPVSLVTPRWWLGDAGIEGRIAADPEVGRWLGVDRLRLLARQCQEQVDRFYSSHGEPGARYFVEKFGPAQTAADLARELYPDAREIVLVRDFRDLYCSIRSYVDRQRGRTGFGWSPERDPAEYVRTVIRGFASAIRARWEAERERAHLIRYEDLVNDPEAVMTQAARYIGVDSSPDVVHEALVTATRGPSAWAGHRTSPDPSASIGRWRSELSDELKTVFAEELAEHLEAFGYDPR